MMGLADIQTVVFDFDALFGLLGAPLGRLGTHLRRRGTPWGALGRRTRL